MKQPKRLRALMPHHYANRQLQQGDVYTPESETHTRLLVLMGRATICDDIQEKAPETDALPPGIQVFEPVVSENAQNLSALEVQDDSKKGRRRRRRKSKETPSE